MTAGASLCVTALSFFVITLFGRSAVVGARRGVILICGIAAASIIFLVLRVVRLESFQRDVFRTGITMLIGIILYPARRRLLRFEPVLLVAKPTAAFECFRLPERLVERDRFYSAAKCCGVAALSRLAFSAHRLQEAVGDAAEIERWRFTCSRSREGASSPSFCCWFAAVDIASEPSHGGDARLSPVQSLPVFTPHFVSRRAVNMPIAFEPSFGAFGVEGDRVLMISIAFDQSLVALGVEGRRVLILSIAFDPSLVALGVEGQRVVMISIAFDQSLGALEVEGERVLIISIAFDQSLVALGVEGQRVRCIYPNNTLAQTVALTSSHVQVAHWQGHVNRQCRSDTRS
jgi:hypothetical protein